MECYGRGQKAEGRRQRAEGRGQRAEGRGQEAEGKGLVAGCSRSILIYRATAIVLFLNVIIDIQNEDTARLCPHE
jgi:hypothetical protein